MCSGFWETLRFREAIRDRAEHNVEEFLAVEEAKEHLDEYLNKALYTGAFDLD